MVNNVVIVGSSGALGKAFTYLFSEHYPNASIHAFSRQLPNTKLANVHYEVMDYSDETSIEACAHSASQANPIDIVIVATGMLHDANTMPEKSLSDLSRAAFQRLFEVNTVLPAMLAKHFLPKLNKTNPSTFVALSARVGSISDNRLGGWYAYRASKSALNMVLKNAAIEIKRTNKKSLVIGLHPGTVDSQLSKPFQANVPKDKLFSPEYSAKKLWEVIQALSPEETGQCYDWDGKEVPP